jgi:hypothetical protein
MDCGSNTYEVSVNNKMCTISGYCYLVFDCYNWENGVYLISKSGYYILKRWYAKELVDIINKQIQDSYDVGGRHYIESESKVEQLCN